MATSKLYYNPFIPAFSNIGVPVAQAKLYFFYSQTTNPAPVYSDSALTVPLTNPVQANLAGKYPDIYLDSAVVYRVVQTDSFGIPLGDAVDPYIPGQSIKGDPGGNVMAISLFSGASSLSIPLGTNLVQTSGWSVSGKGVARYAYDVSVNSAYVAANPRTSFISANGRGFKLSEAFPDITMFGAVGAPTDDTASIQAAIDSKTSLIYAPSGEWYHTNLTFNNDFQRLYGPGAKFTRIAANTTVLVTARGVFFNEVRFGCQTSGMAGNNVTVSGPDFSMVNCWSTDTGGRAVLILNAGGGININGGKYQTTDQSATSYDIEFRDDAGGGNTLYCWVSNIVTNQHYGGILITGEVGSMAINSCEFGKLRMDNTGASKVDNCRIGGAVTILSGFSSFSQNDFNDDIVFGQDGQPNIGSIRFASTNTQKSGKNLKVSNNVVESTFHFEHLQASGSVLTINKYGSNSIWHSDRDITGITIGAQSGTPSVGSGTMVSRISSSGRRRILSIDYSLGSDSSMGSGNFFYFVSPFTAKSSSVFTAQVTDAGTGFFDLVGRQLSGSNQIYFFPSSGGNTAVGNNASATNPFTWATGDRIIFNAEVEELPV